MIPRIAPTLSGSRPPCRLTGVCLLLAGSALTAACDSVPLLAPSGSTITLTASNNAIPANGTAQLIAYVLEQSGTPPHPGTQVIFTTTLGVVEPAEATTDINGRAMATFRGNGQNGTATINAISGAASTAAGGGGTNNGGTTTTPTNSGTGPVRISVGTAAVGRITLTANPTTISANGGSAVVTANVVDVNGNALAGAPVSFATSAGVLTGSLVNTDSNGNAQTTLTTSIEATVTANVGAAGSGTGTGGTPGGGSSSGQTTATVTVKVNPLLTVSIAGPDGTNAAGTPITFTLNVQVPTTSTAQVREVVINFGDGTSVNLGAVSGQTKVQHRYDEDGTFTVSARVTDTLGSVVTAATAIVIEPKPPLSVTVTYNKATSGQTTLVTFQATVSPSTTTVVQYLWNFGDNTPNQATTSNQVVHPYTVAGSYQVNVQVTTSTGDQSVGQTVVVVP